MTKVLHISKYYNPAFGGIESTCENIVNVLSNYKEYTQMVFCFGNSDIDKVDGIPVKRVKSFVKIRSQSIAILYTHKLKQTIKEFKPDIILYHSPNPLAARSLLKSHYKGKIVIFHHSDIVKQKIIKKLVQPYISKLYKKASKIIVTSNNYLNNSEDLRSYKDKCIVIPLCYRIENITLHPYESEGVNAIRDQYKKPIALYTSRHIGYKGLEYAIEAFKDIPDMTFVVAGHGPLTKKLRKKAKPYSNIQFVGMLSSKLHRLYLNSCDFFIFPSHQKNEAFGLTLLEALAAGKPAITFKLEGSAVNYLNLDKITGLESKNESVNDLKEKIIILKNDENLRKEYGENAKKRCEELFSYQAFDKNISEFFKNL